MTSVKFKLESGVQLLARLRKKTDICNFYPNVFEGGPKYGEVIEIIYKDTATCFLMDIIAEALMPNSLGGIETGVLILSTDGNMNYEELISIIKNKLFCTGRLQKQEPVQPLFNDLLQSTLSNLHIMEIYDANQLYATIHNLETVSEENPNISLIVFDTLTAFYWSEQSFKITRMDMYLKNLIRLIRKITNDYKVSILYTRPEYFNSSKDLFGNTEGCALKLDNIDYSVQLLSNDDNSYEVTVKTCSKSFKKAFIISDNEIKWI